MSSRKSYLLQTEHARMAELERRVGSACRESQDQAAELAAAWAEGQLAAERATTAERGLEATKACQAETEAGLWASLASTEAVLQEAVAALESERSALASERAALESARMALEAERRARSEADQEVLALRGRVMGTEEANTWLCAQATRQAEEFSTLENSRTGTYPFLFFVALVSFFSLFLSLLSLLQSWMER